jgi:flagellar hook-length control protein FliK
MKNLSLPMSTDTALKSTTSKSESNNKSLTAEPGAFKAMLSNQLQNQAQARQLQVRQSQDRKSVDKSTQDKQLQSRQLQDKQLQDNQDLAKQNALKPELVTPVAKSQQPVNKPATSANAKLDSAEQNDAVKVVVDNASALSTSNANSEPALADNAALKAQETAKHVTETNAANLLAAFNVAVVNPQAQAQSVEAAGSRQKNMDNVLNQALTQSKAGAVADKNSAQAMPESTDVAQKANWLDSVLPTALRQAAGDDIAQTKVQHSAIQQAATQQALSQQNTALQTGSNQNSTQLNTVQQNLAQQAGVIAATMPPALQSAVVSPAVAQAGSSNFIQASPGKSGWDQAISQKVMWMAGEGGVQSATLTLNPPDLGPLQVVIHVNNDMVEAQFMSDNADVRQALQDGLTNLRDKMNEAGIQLGQTNVSAGGQAQQEFQQAGQGQRAQRMAGAESLSAAETAAVKPAVIRTANGLVDTFA